MTLLGPYWTCGEESKVKDGTWVHSVRRRRGCEEVQRIYNSYSRALNSYGSEVTSYSMVVKGY